MVKIEQHGENIRNVRAQTVEIHPGITKIVVTYGGGDGGEAELLMLDQLNVDTWRFRLPASAKPELATAVFVDGELIVTVPKASPSFTLIPSRKHGNLAAIKLNNPWLVRRTENRRVSSVVRAYKVIVEHEGKTTELEVEPDETILSKALDVGMSVPYDCKLGVCMTCPAKLLSGNVDQSEGMLSDDVVDRGYALLCAAYPRSDCHIRVIPEEELLSLQLATADD
ncbi:hypothetical protein RDI58_006639 [Solanum bulbocastanum]|uniref:2Fe-2S ferredoxin-type domain-containing protein n=1 Tax=Solanum bulbocastanum TaxID=147425 RepID=A0AAN8TX80_SOLBU